MSTSFTSFNTPSHLSVSSSMTVSRSSPFRHHQNYNVHNDDLVQQQKHEQNYFLCSVLAHRHTARRRWSTSCRTVCPSTSSHVVFLYVALSGTLLFLGDNPRQVFHTISRGCLGITRTRWALLSPSTRDLCRTLLDVKPSQWPTAWGS